MWWLLSVDTKLAISLLKLAIPASLHYISHLFGMGKVTARKAVLDICGTLQTVLGRTMLQTTLSLALAPCSQCLGLGEARISWLTGMWSWWCPAFSPAEDNIAAGISTFLHQLM
ncbi:hypothetical protein Y1Q_0012170 [Alligator mississippiensis]|uniref:Uncharacterized protein n=1 Tax=Alligator mississippiensis TaxID=8496 RepID=A0A151N599_ALLMI|nr:hypothetical protein Y1Q_0012170 [Alligator mississippiensis]